MKYRVDYYAKPTEMTDDSSVSDLPDSVNYDVLATLVAGELLYAQYNDDPLGIRGKGLLNTGYANLSTFYGKNQERAKQFRKTVKRKPWGDLNL